MVKLRPDIEGIRAVVDVTRDLASCTNGSVSHV
jgi:hypothetical protein